MLRSVMRLQLTDLTVERFKPVEGKQIDIFDMRMPGLVLRVSYGGTKTWRALFYVHGKARSFGLGRYPIVGLRQARERARAFLLNPQAALVKVTSGTVAEIVAEFLTRYVEKKGL